MNGGTSIMATVTRERCSREFLTALRREGMESVRINSAHVTEEELKQMIMTIRNIDSGIKILMDTKGPEIRTSATNSCNVMLREGTNITLTGGTAATDSSTIFVTVENLHECVSTGMPILIDDGALMLKVTDVTDNRIMARVERGGELGSRKTVSIPDARIPQLPAVSERDRANIRAAKSAGIDMIAHSFVRSAADVEAVRHELEGTGITLFAKIECREALENFDEILSAADGLLVARGDLGTQVDISEIPAIQYRAIASCRKVRKPVIVATQILQSMISSPTPTRAEASDIALAVMEGADTLLLCGETAVGQYPTECVAMMRRTIESITRNNLQCKIH